MDQDADILSRKGFLKQSLSYVLGEIANQLPDFGAPAKPVPEQRVLRPPGALPDTTFTTVCEPFCNACRDVCPRNSIFQDQYGFPYLSPDVSPCVMCTDVPCTTVCPTDALSPLDDPRLIAMGTAVIEVTQCTAFQGSGCQTCYDVCPIQSDAIQLIEGLPQIMPEYCTGCGFCVFECPTPDAIAIRAH